mmetsp:Transcript_11415/g.18906  ORF Transcript_11415/g.18906 Transcript_11415/m.18906 type:complete len:496 (-) Transcript_11415:119-1606(-)
MGNILQDITEDGNVWDDQRMLLPEADWFTEGGTLDDFVNPDKAGPEELSSTAELPQLLVAPNAGRRTSRGFDMSRLDPRRGGRRLSDLFRRSGEQKSIHKSVEEEKEQFWTIEIDRTSGERLGLSMRVSKQGRLEITNVAEGGLIASWNSSSPSKALRRGDRILEVNGESDKEQISRRLSTHDVLCIAVARDEDSETFDEGVKNPHKVVLHPGAGDDRISRSQGSPASSSSSTPAMRFWTPLDECVGLRAKVLLTEQRLLELHPFLPLSVRFASRWKLIYCPRVHGTSLRTFYRQCQAWPGETLFFVEDTNGAVFGGFASCAWKVAREKVHFGAPDCFVFSYGMQDNQMLQVFPWSGGNQYYMYADADGFSMGGGRGYAVWIDKDFHRGTSDPSNTFGNEASLASGSEFYIRHFECWTFDSNAFGSTTGQAFLEQYRRGDLESPADYVAADARRSSSAIDETLIRGEEGSARRRATQDLQLRDFACEATRFEAVT